MVSGWRHEFFRFDPAASGAAGAGPAPSAGVDAVGCGDSWVGPGRGGAARSGQVAVAIGSVRAYPNGFEFTLHTRLRGEDETGPGRGDPLERHGWRRGSRAPDEGLRLGVGYADGRRAAAPSGHPRPGDDRGRLVVLQNGGGGSGRSWDGNLWVHPLPPDGPVTFVVSWLEQGVAETAVELDGAAIREATGVR